MRQLFWTPVALCLVLSGCQESRPVAPPAQPIAKKEQPPAVSPPTAAATIEVESETARKTGPGNTAASENGEIRSGEFIIGKPMGCENLTVFPILSQMAKDDDRFITLDEGLTSGAVEVMEVGARPTHRTTSDDDRFQGDDAIQQPTTSGRHGRADVVGDVIHLLVVNTSGKPLYLMPGEVIVGGRQDRSIAVETIVEPNGEPVSVEVYCVEHGRWHRRSSADFGMMASAFLEDADDGKVEELVEKAAEGKFVGKAGNLSKKARFSAQAGEGQLRVWEEVGYANSANGVLSGSDAFTSNYSQKDVKDKLEPYLKHLEQPVAELDRVVGVVVAVNGKVEMADVYESTPLFKKLWPKLLKSYALDAAAVADAKNASQVCTVAAAKEFFDKAREAGVETTHGEGGLIVTVRSSDGVKSFSAGMGGIGEGFGKGIHGAAY